MAYTDEELRTEATNTRDLHDPEKQEGSTAYPGRCELCHYTRHPCDAFDMADAVLRLLDRVSP